MEVSLKNFDAEKLKKFVTLGVAQRLEVAAILLQNDIKERISEPSPPASVPGESPHKDTGRLRASISRRVDKANLTAEIGTNVIYGKFLELGTKYLPARPFIRPALHQNAAKLRQILKGES